jgi:hypothetical protein
MVYQVWLESCRGPNADARLLLPHQCSLPEMLMRELSDRDRAESLIICNF